MTHSKAQAKRRFDAIEAAASKNEFMADGLPRVHVHEFVKLVHETRRRVGNKIGSHAGALGRNRVNAERRAAKKAAAAEAGE